MYQSANNHSILKQDFVIICNPESGRVTLFQDALKKLGLPYARTISYKDILNNRLALSSVVRSGSVVRIESPDKETQLERDFITAGANVIDDENFPRISKEGIQRLPIQKGEILYPRQWYRGFCEVLDLIRTQLAVSPQHTLMNHPDEIKIMFDKVHCHRLLSSHRIAVPATLGEVRSYDELFEKMRKTGRYRVFIKLAHGSSASGVVAYQTDGRRHKAETTVEMVRNQSELQLYNSRKIRRYHDQKEISELINALCRHRAHVEEWIPKAGFEGKTFDLRIVVIDKKAGHAVVRSSAGPLTNLHLLNQRRDASALKHKMGCETWRQILKTCESVMSCFPNSLYAGIDVAVHSRFKRHFILEVNAFGDLLKGVLNQGCDTYTAEVLALLAAERYATNEPTGGRALAESNY